MELSNFELDLVPPGQTRGQATYDAPGTAPESTSLHKFVSFGLGSKTYCLPAELVEEVSNPLPTTRLPGTPPGVAGIAPLRGDIVAVIDLRSLLNERNLTTTNRSKFIISRTVGTDMRVAFPVDRVFEMIEIDLDHNIVPANATDTLLFGSGAVGDTEFNLIDPDKLRHVLAQEHSD